MFVDRYENVELMHQENHQENVEEQERLREFSNGICDIGLWSWARTEAETSEEQESGGFWMNKARKK